MADEKVKTVLDDMASRREFDSTSDAANYIMKCASEISDFGDFPIVSPYDARRQVSGLGTDSDGNLVFDSELFPEEMRVMVSTLATRGEGTGSSKIKCIVVSPIPSFDMIVGSESGKKWLDKIISTELNRVAVRNLRDTKDSVTDVNDLTVLDSMPKTLDDYVTSSRGGASTLLEAFEKLWQPIKKVLGQPAHFKPWKLANLSKKEFKNGMSSAAYASQYYPTLEDAALGKGKRGSMFVLAIQLFQLEAKKAGLDTAIFDQWLATRDQYVIEEGEEESEEDISLDSLSGMLAQDEAEPEANEAAEGAANSESEEAPAEA